MSKIQLIYFDNESISLSPDYYVQQMYGANSGNIYIPSSIFLEPQCCGKCEKPNKAFISDDIKNRFGVSTVIDEKTGDTIIRIANMLPVGVDVNLNGYPTGIAEVSVLTGSPKDTKVAPTFNRSEINGFINVPEYSFSTVRIFSKP